MIRRKQKNLELSNKYCWESTQIIRPQGSGNSWEPAEYNCNWKATLTFQCTGDMIRWQHLPEDHQTTNGTVNHAVNRTALIHRKQKKSGIVQQVPLGIYTDYTATGISGKLSVVVVRFN